MELEPLNLPELTQEHRYIFIRDGRGHIVHEVKGIGGTEEEALRDANKKCDGFISEAIVMSSFEIHVSESKCDKPVTNPVNWDY